ncbi:hypothetical protein CSUI_005411 [Cystoisospora suis]|uniref:Uncharacterized protein n=1 Tax=Cystoisospora suis TaxID=483139 RepID=A0A2C6K6B3_9APIC|nr:hypothetical protein CSUI_005411 [Cystoisospora suis]
MSVEQEGSPPRNAKPLPDTARAATGDADPSAEQIRSADRRPEAALREPDPAAKESYGASYLFFTNEVAVGVSRFDYTLSRTATAGERMSWLRILEAEERDRLESLRASMDALKTESTPTSVRVNALLASALQAQITLMKMSRVFPDHAVSRRVDPTRALRHGATVALASELRRCWEFLGVTERTLKDLLWLALNAISRRTLLDRQELFPDTGRKPRHKEPQPKPEEALVAEGLTAIQQWDLLERLRVWAAIGYLKLSAEDEGGLLGQFTTDDSFLRDGACPRLADGCSYLVLSNEVAADIHPSDYTLSRVATGENQAH